MATAVGAASARVLARAQALPDQVNTWTWPVVYSAMTAVCPSGVIWMALTSVPAVPMVVPAPTARLLSVKG